MMQQEFTIEHKIESSKIPYYCYEHFVKFYDTREGYCRTFIDLVRKCSFQFTDAQMRRFKTLGINKTDTCICLDDFHPHGKGLDPNKCAFMRKGIGTRVLERIIGSLKKHNSKFIYCVASTESMKLFMIKQKWIPCNRRKTVWYRLLSK